MVDFKNLPKIYVQDPNLIWYGFDKNDIVKSIFNGETQYHYIID